MDCGYFKLGGTCDLLGLEKYTLCVGEVMAHKASLDLSGHMSSQL